MQLIFQKFDGKVEKNTLYNFGKTKIKINTKSILFKIINKENILAVMSHNDTVTKMPKGFEIIANLNKSILGIEK